MRPGRGRRRQSGHTIFTAHSGRTSGTNRRDEHNLDSLGLDPWQKIVARALQTYGMFLADNGSSWYLSGESNAKWDDDDLEQLKTIPGSAFEVVKIDQILKDPQ